MMFEDRRIEAQELKPYRGYKIDKSWEMIGKKRVPKSVRYMVIDEEDDWIGDVYNTLDEAKAYIDSLLDTEVKASTRVVKASTAARTWSDFSKWYDSLTSKQRNVVDDIADEEGLPLYEECNDEELSWIRDEAEIVLKDFVDSDLVNGPVPAELEGLSWIASAKATNPTFNDDLLRIAEEGYDAIKVRFDYVKDGKLIGSGWNFAFESKQDFDSFAKEIKSKRIPLVTKPRVLMTIDWNKAYNIQIDSYYDGTHKLQWHNVGTKVPQN